MKVSYNAIDIANYILWQSNIMGIKGVTHLKLQKLLYYVVARYLKNTNNSLLNESVSKWQYGPVVKSVYHQFKIFGDKSLKPVTYLSSESNYSGNGDFIIKFADVDSINQSLSQVIDIHNVVSFVITELGGFSAFELVDRTHAELAWKNFETDILRGVDLTYSLDELRAASI